MGPTEDALDPLSLGHPEVDPRLGIHVVTQHRDDRVALVENHEPTVQIGHRHVVSLDGRRRGHSQPGHDLGDELSVEAVMHQSPLGLVVAIADENSWRVVTRVQCHPMRGVELLQTVALRTEVHQVLAGLVVLEDVVAGVAIGENDVTVGGHGDRRWTEWELCLLPLVQTRLFGERQSQHDVAGHRMKLDPLPGTVPGRINEFVVALLANLHVVDVRVVLAQELANHLARGCENKNPSIGAGVDVACLVDHNSAVGRPEHRLAVGVQSPARNGFEGHQATAHPHRLHLVGSEHRQRQAKKNRGRDGE